MSQKFFNPFSTDVVRTLNCIVVVIVLLNELSVVIQSNVLTCYYVLQCSLSTCLGTVYYRGQ